MTMAQLPKLDNSNLVDKTYSILKDMIIMSPLTFFDGRRVAICYVH